MNSSDPASSDRSVGMRERKMTQSRLAIRREAFRLFEQQGYADTTVEQIAAAAEVSPRTLYRYFGGKEGLLMSDDHIAPIVEAFVNAPRDLGYVQAYRHAVTAVFGSLNPEQREDAITGQRILYTVPEARGLVYSAYLRLADLVTTALLQRPDGPADEQERQVMASAIVGVLMVTSHGVPLPQAALERALSVLDDKLS